MSESYPGVDDWQRYTLDALPSVCRAGHGGAWAVALSTVQAQRELVLEGLARELADLEVAGRFVLEGKAALYGVNASGVTTAELRRLVVGARAAGASTSGSDDDLYRMWTALCGTDDVRVRTVGVMTLSSALEARITWEPSAAWLRAAGRIVAKTVEAGADWDAVVHVGGVLRWGAVAPGWGVGTWAYPLRKP